jgi:hypothetical protein
MDSKVTSSKYVFHWGHIKDQVGVPTKVTSLNHLKERTVLAVEGIPLQTRDSSSGLPVSD